MNSSQQDQYVNPERADDAAFFHIVRRSRVLVLLIALLLQIALGPLLDMVPLLDVFIHLGLIGAAIYTVADENRHLKIGLALGIPALVFLIAARAMDLQVLGWLAYLFTLSLYIFVIRLLLSHIFRAKQVTLDTIGMALCTYVMIGALWMLFYIPINALDPEAFHFSRAVIHGNATESLTYFSYVTLTTLGYGDVYPVSPIARSFAILEALTGTLFLAVLISRLVGKYASSQPEDSS